MTRKTISRLVLVAAYLAYVVAFALVWRWSESVS